MLKFRNMLTLRAAVLLCVLQAANLSAMALLYRHHLNTDVAAKQAVVFAKEIDNIRTDLELIPPETRAQWLRRFNDGGTVSLERLPTGAIIDHPLSSGYLETAQASLRRNRGDDIRVGVVQNADPALILDFNAQGARYRLKLPGAGLTSLGAWAGAWITLSSGLIVLIVVLFVISQVNRPLRRTAAALRQSADQLTEIQMPATAPAEFRIFADRFNALARRLRAQEKERSLLLSGVSHDLRAPLTRIRMNAEIVDDLAPGKGGRILRDSESMRHIIDQFLDHQRGVNPGLARPTDVRSLIETKVNQHLDIGQDVRYVECCEATLTLDPTALERILDNLIDNAVDYGEIPIEIRTRIEGSSLAISVRDHGPGIAQDQVARLLQPFERLDESRSAHGHCGLGLSIVDRLVKQLKGRLVLRNHDEGGLLVSIHLPLEAAASREDAADGSTSALRAS